MVKIYKGDVGTELIIDLQESIEAATAIKIIILRPTRTDRVLVVDPTSVAATSVTYKTVNGDLDTVGKYWVQVYYEDPVWSGYSSLAQFTIGDIFYDVAGAP